MSNFRIRRQLRRGGATVELAICLPLITLLAFSAIEVSNKIFLQESLTQAAYEGALVGARKGGTATKAEDRVSAILTARNVNGFSASLSPTAIETLPAGSQITITVTAPVGGNSLLPGQLFPRANLSARLTFVKEEL